MNFPAVAMARLPRQRLRAGWRQARREGPQPAFLVLTFFVAAMRGDPVDEVADLRGASMSDSLLSPVTRKSSRSIVSGDGLVLPTVKKRSRLSSSLITTNCVGETPTAADASHSPDNVFVISNVAPSPAAILAAARVVMVVMTIATAAAGNRLISVSWFNAGYRPGLHQIDGPASEYPPGGGYFLFHPITGLPFSRGCPRTAAHPTWPAAERRSLAPVARLDRRRFQTHYQLRRQENCTPAPEP